MCHQDLDFTTEAALPRGLSCLSPDLRTCHVWPSPLWDICLYAPLLFLYVFKAIALLAVLMFKVAIDLSSPDVLLSSNQSPGKGTPDFSPGLGSLISSSGTSHREGFEPLTFNQA